MTVNNLQALPTWKSSLGHPSASMLGLFGCMQVVGAFLMSIPMAYIMDNWGRRLTLALGGFVCVIGGLIQAFSYSQGQYIVGRILVGCSQSFQLVGGNIMISELAHPRIRYKIVGFYQVGHMIAIWADSHRRSHGTSDHSSRPGFATGCASPRETTLGSTGGFPLS